MAAFWARPGEHLISSADAAVNDRDGLSAHVEEPNHVTLRFEPSAAVVQVSGDVDLDIAVELWAVLEKAAGARRTVVVDLTRAGTVDSTGVGALVRGRTTARHGGGDLVLAGPSGFLLTVLRTVGLHNTFPTFPTVYDAVAAAENGVPREPKR